ncbi:MAG: glycosyltransferase [Bacteroidia bacterium]|nr:glycosyltransferase [Bacteroidia bacterium]
MILLTYTGVILLLFYVLLIGIYWIGWRLIKPFKNTTSNHLNKFSILIPARNEAEVITACIQSIINQNYNPNNYEIIIINDYSTDDTQMEVEGFIAKNKNYQIKLVNMVDDGKQRKLKKAAITAAIEQAINPYIVLTDADCTRKSNWLSTINNFIDANGSKLIYAPVEFKANNTFERMQSLEFAGLVGIGASAIQLKNPNMCSAANLIFEKDVFNEVGGYKGNDGIASGDDEFLLHKVFKRYPNKINFLKHIDAVVSTTANASIKQLTDQRKRWVSKSTKYENRYITAVMVGAYLFNFIVALLLIVNFKMGLILLLIKAIVEGLFLFDVMRFFKRTTYLLLLPLAEPFHILYVLIIGIWGNIGTYNWKDRKLK